METKKISRVEYHPNMPICIILTHALYCLPGCGCGGMAHVVIDDENLGDSYIDSTIADCESKEYADRPERFLVCALMKYLKQMSIEQRYLMYKFASDYVGDVNDFVDTEYCWHVWKLWFDENEDYINSEWLPELEKLCEITNTSHDIDPIPDIEPIFRQTC